jgi:hypothetical protein
VRAHIYPPSKRERARAVDVLKNWKRFLDQQKPAFSRQLHSKPITNGRKEKRKGRVLIVSERETKEKSGENRKQK